MASTLTFEKLTTASGNLWAAKFTSQGACVIEMERKSHGLVAITANLEGMAEVPVTNFQNPYGKNVIFEVDVPEGVEITVKSESEVTKAAML